MIDQCRLYLLIICESLKCHNFESKFGVACSPNEKEVKWGTETFATSQCMYVTVAQTRQSFPSQEGSITKLLHLSVSFLPLERSFLGAAAAAAPPVAAAQAPFSCSSPLLLVRLLFFPLLFFWLGILQDSGVTVIFFFDLYQRLLSTLCDISVDSISAEVFSRCCPCCCCCCCCCSSWTAGLFACSSDSSSHEE